MLMQVLFILAALTAIAAIVVTIKYKDVEILVCFAIAAMLLMILGAICGINKNSSQIADSTLKIVLNEDKVHVIGEDTIPYTIIEKE